MKPGAAIGGWGVDLARGGWIDSVDPDGALDGWPAEDPETAREGWLSDGVAPGPGDGSRGLTISSARTDASRSNLAIAVARVSGFATQVVGGDGVRVRVP